MPGTFLVFRRNPLVGIRRFVTNENTFALAPPVDSFTVGDVELLSIANTDVVVRFTTSANSKAYIDYGEDNNYGNQNNGEWTFDSASHSQDITALEPGTTYLYKIVAINEADEQATASGSLTTTRKGDGAGTVPFTVGAIEILELENTKAHIELTTSVNAQTYIECGIDTDYGSRTTKEESFDMATHRQPLKNLEPSTTYYYRIRANTKSWQTASATGSFTTVDGSGDEDGTNENGQVSFGGFTKMDFRTICVHVLAVVEPYRKTGSM